MQRVKHSFGRLHEKLPDRSLLGESGTHAVVVAQLEQECETDCLRVVPLREVLEEADGHTRRFVRCQAGRKRETLEILLGVVGEPIYDESCEIAACLCVVGRRTGRQVGFGVDAAVRQGTDAISSDQANAGIPDVISSRHVAPSGFSLYNPRVSTFVEF
nr:hypothetical protein [Frondihabitans sp. PAMC 28766]